MKIPAPATAQVDTQTLQGKENHKDLRPEALASQQRAALAKQSSSAMQLSVRQQMMDASRRTSHLQGLVTPQSRPGIDPIQGQFWRDRNRQVAEEKLPGPDLEDETVNNRFRAMRRSRTRYIAPDGIENNRAAWLNLPALAEEEDTEDELPSEAAAAIVSDDEDDDVEVKRPVAAAAAAAETSDDDDDEGETKDTSIKLGSRRIVYRAKRAYKKNLEEDLRQDFFGGRFPSGAKARLNGWINNPNETKDFPSLDALAAELRPPAAAKRKRNGERKVYDPEIHLPRAANTDIGRNVDFRTHRAFRTERRIRRRFPQKLLNLYVTRYVRADGKGIKVVTVSQPAGALPAGHESMSLGALVARTHIGHSEHQTDLIEKKYAAIRGLRRTMEATTREQCLACRRDFPIRATGSHFFGSPYPAPANHIHNAALRAKIIANGGVIGGIKGLSADERRLFSEAKDSATFSRRAEKLVLNQWITKLERENTDSDGDYSDDDDEIHIASNVLKGRKNPRFGAFKKLGKGNITIIPDDQLMPDHEYKAQATWIETQRARAAADSQEDDDDDEDAALSSDDEEEQEAKSTRQKPQPDAGGANKRQKRD